MSRVAIGIPVFNEAKYIAKTLYSVLSQFEDCSDLEVCISDNGSSDDSVREIEAVLDSFSGPISKVRFNQHSTNAGPEFNFWHVYDATDSDYFLWVGAHDLISHRYASLGLKHLNESPDISMFCGAHMAIALDDKVAEQAVVYDFGQENPAERYLRSISSLNNCYIFHSMFRRNSLDGFDRSKKTPSGDHVLISRWLWAGRLVQSRECGYLRRYFPSENREQKTLLGSYAHGRNNVQFFDAYLSDLENLTLDLPHHIRDALIRRASDLLIQRFGIPFVEPM